MPPFAALPRRLLAGLVTLSLVASFGATAAPARAADGGELFFSEYVEGSSNNKALEIYNPNDNAVDLGGYGVTVYFNGATATVGTRLTLLLSGESIAGKGVYILASSSADPAILAVADQTTGSGLWNGDDAITLVHNGTVIDVIGQIGNDPGSQWGSGDASTQDNTLRRKATVLIGDPNGSDAFDPSVQWDGYPEDTFGGLGSHSTATGGNQAVSITCGASVQVLEGASESTTITATDPDGIVTDISIASVTPPDPGISITSVTPATENGGEASATLTVADTTAAGSYSVNLTATNADAPAQTASCTLSVQVNAIKTIGEVQGPVADDANPTTQASPFDGDTVVVQGVVTQATLARTSAGGQSWSFYIQNSLATDDGDPLTSDGLNIFNGRFRTIRFSAGGPQYTPVVGDEIVVSGRIDEYFNMTELESPFIERVVRHGVDLSTELASVEANPSHDLHVAQVFWERHESMLLSVPAGAQVTAPRDVFASTADGEVWVIRGDDPLAQRADPYARRVFRDFHPLDDDPALFDNENGERILLTSHGLKAAANDDSVLIAPARTLDTVTNQLSGVVNYSFSKYGIEVAQQPQLQAGADPAQNAPPQPTVAGEEYATSDYNVENLYDFRDDPNDGCDFLGNTGCPGVSPPFDYVPLSQADYDQHLSDLATQIAGPMHAPDILMIQEAEDQDICSLVAGAMSCGTADDADGQPDTLQDLALAVSAIGGPTYLTAYDRDGADDRGIVSAFMYRTDSVELLPVSADDPVLGSAPTVDYRSEALPYNTDVSNPKALNAVLPGDVSGDTDGDNVYTRAPQVGHFRVWRDGIGQSVFTDLYAISNHFSSGPDGRVEQRTEQAAYNAAIVAALQGANPDERVVSAGDFNVFPRPDDPFPDDPSDQLAALYDAGLHNLFDVLVDEVPSSAYSYVFEGQAQTLDQQFATSSLFDELVQIRAAHINADYAADYAGDVARGASDHDPQVARWTTDVTFARLVDLVDYYVATGQVDASKAGKLYDRLDKAAALLAAGQTDAYRSQLRALGDQAQDLAPQWMTPVAASSLEKEADRLAGM